MTKKNTRKVAARARQAKSGGKYMSALRAEGPEILKIHWRDPDTVAHGSAESAAKFNSGHSHFIRDDGCYVLVNRHFDEEGKPTDRFRPSLWIFPEAMEVLRRLARPNAGPTDNIIRRRHEGLVRMLIKAMEECARVLDGNGGPGFEGEPMFEADITFTFASGSQIKIRPAWELKAPIPEPIPSPSAREV